MTDEAIKAKYEYFKHYRAEHRERMNENRRKWAQEHPEKIKQYQSRYWERKAQVAYAGGQ